MTKFARKALRAALCTGFGAALLTAAPALAAGNPAGKIQVKLLGTAVLPDGKITRIEKDLIGLPAGTQTEANDNYVPTIAIEYFLTPQISAETICCVTRHKVTGTGALAGAGLVSNANIIPATLTLKYHFTGLPGFKPYIGAGPSYFIFVSEKPGATAAALGATRQRMNDHFGFALQAGADVPLGQSGFGLTLDAKRYFLRTSAHWFAGTTEVLVTRHKIDPWVLSAGVAYRF
ncbi:OmpW/AlkL family protein [Novosphingobium lentum]|uniref:OmpW/AlkL family protein n=1 Tax=Novosphingobium lentum TaxID=145287 RepID=UPI00083387F6|nr:OmpW family outer membrane protein [Novosphingobium lentum]